MPPNTGISPSFDLLNNNLYRPEPSQPQIP